MSSFLKLIPVFFELVKGLFIYKAGKNAEKTKSQGEALQELREANAARRDVAVNPRSRAAQRLRSKYTRKQF